MMFLDEIGDLFGFFLADACLFDEGMGGGAELILLYGVGLCIF